MGGPFNASPAKSTLDLPAATGAMGWRGPRGVIKDGTLRKVYGKPMKSRISWSLWKVDHGILWNILSIDWLFYGTSMENR